MDKKQLRQLFSLPVIVAALGYFVDIYDLLLFSIVRIESLKSMGVPEGELFDKGEFLLQVQMIGLLVGGIIWGVMGDKKGRLSVLFGSILLYSLANIANGFVTTVFQYAVLRFIAGIGLAGELGAGITLVSETLPPKLRGWGTTIVATVGLMGAVLANVISSIYTWQTSYFIGGGLGLMLLAARVSVFESGLFLRTVEKTISRGNFFQLFQNRERFKKFMGCIFIGLPIWYAIGILITFSPEFAAALGVGKIKAGDAVMLSYLGLAAGDMTSGFLSQTLRTRKGVVRLFIFLTMLFILLYLFSPVKSTTFFFFTCFTLGFGIGYWALFVTIAAEQFGTNLRATVATSVPNFIRGTVFPLTLLFRFLRNSISEYFEGSGAISDPKHTGLIYGALIVGLFTIIVAFLSLRAIDETFGRDLNFEEQES
jgi:MFS transporter, putative metabolite:H+ symporter